MYSPMDHSFFSAVCHQDVLTYIATSCILTSPISFGVGVVACTCVDLFQLIQT
jgi:hypothetical protein